MHNNPFLRAVYLALWLGAVCAGVPESCDRFRHGHSHRDDDLQAFAHRDCRSHNIRWLEQEDVTEELLQIQPHRNPSPHVHTRGRQRERWEGGRASAWMYG